MPPKAKKRRRAGQSSGGLPSKAEHPGHVWALDFCHDATESGTELRFCNVIDEFTREAPASAYYRRKNGPPSRRAVEDERLLAEIRKTHEANYEAYGYRRTWKALKRAGEEVARCTVQRLMREHGIRGAKRRGKPWRTTRPDPEAARRPDLVSGTSPPRRQTGSGSPT